MTARALRRPTFVAALVAAATLGLTACFGGAPPPGGGPPPPAGTEPDPSTAPPVACASVEAEEAPLVTVEATPDGPEITSTPVETPEEEAAVIAEAAADGDLVAVERDVPVQADAPDPYRPQQWALNNVPFEAAWAAAATDGDGQVVAVVDTGVQAGHPDLAGQVLTGAFFLHSNDFGTAFTGAGGTTDPNGHGTHVAGIVGAVAENGIGISGAAPGVQILPVQVLCADGGGFSSDVANGIKWAADNGADVINLSLGGGFSSAEQSAVQYARSLGVVVVASAGNDGLNGPASYPAAYPQAIAVGATTSSNQRASFSTTGSYLDLAAPGNGILSTVSVSAGTCDPSGLYCYKSGTSMASPYAAAAAALVLAAHPEYLSPVDVCNQLIRTATDLGGFGFDNHFGHGLINPLLGVGVTAPDDPLDPFDTCT